MAVGLITDAKQAESYLADGRCDLVALAREMMWNRIGRRTPQGAGRTRSARPAAEDLCWLAAPRTSAQALSDGKEQGSPHGSEAECGAVSPRGKGPGLRCAPSGLRVLQNGI